MAKKYESASATRARAYVALGVDPNMVAYSAKFSPFFKKIPGGIPFALEALRACAHPDARKFMFIYDNMAISALYKSVLPLEAFAVAAGLNADQMISLVTAAVKFHAAHLGSITAAGAHPEVVEMSSRLAKVGDLDHATLNMKHMGFLPSPKGSQVNVNVAAHANAHSDSNSQVAVMAPAPENTIRRLVDRFNTSRLTASPAAAALPEHGVTESLPERVPERQPVTIDANYARSGEVEQEYEE